MKINPFIRSDFQSFQIISICKYQKLEYILTSFLQRIKKSARKTNSFAFEHYNIQSLEH